MVAMVMGRRTDIDALITRDLYNFYHCGWVGGGNITYHSRKSSNQIFKINACLRELDMEPAMIGNGFIKPLG